MQDGTGDNSRGKRAIKTFEADPDVDLMLERARFVTVTAGGEKKRIAHQTLSRICNEALRRYLTELGHSRKRDPAPETTAKEHKAA